ncbi:hypothetical protein A5651_14910 [Mycobacterium sp. 1274761.0]|nr:hypothetical protein A5651_14910 [Mycobacterium sp. 1274761.0]
MRVVSLIGCVVCALAAFGLALETSMELFMFGFPDGHTIDYQKAAATPLRILMWLQGGIGLLFLGLAFSPIKTRMRTVGWLTALVVFVLLALTARIGVPWYFGTHLGLDNGIGG